MREFEFINSILHDQYLAADQSVLEELKECDHHDHHIVKILKTRPVDDYSLFRFSLDDDEFLPFFKDSRIGGPKGLRKFCDYIMLIKRDDRLTVALIEMKRSSKDSEYKEQLEASKLFMDYVIANADRIKDQNGYSDFEIESISIRKIRVRKPATIKFTTKPKQSVIEQDKDGYIDYPYPIFNPAYF